MFGKREREKGGTWQDARPVEHPTFPLGADVVISEAVTIGETSGGAGAVTETRWGAGGAGEIVKVELDRATARAAGPHWRYVFCLVGELTPAGGGR